MKPPRWRPIAEWVNRHILLLLLLSNAYVQISMAEDLPKGKEGDSVTEKTSVTAQNGKETPSASEDDGKSSKTASVDVAIESCHMTSTSQGHKVTLYRISPFLLANLSSPMVFHVDSTVSLIIIRINESVPLATSIVDPSGEPLGETPKLSLGKALSSHIYRRKRSVQFASTSSHLTDHPKSLQNHSSSRNNSTRSTHSLRLNSHSFYRNGKSPQSSRSSSRARRSPKFRTRRRVTSRSTWFKNRKAKKRQTFLEEFLNVKSHSSNVIGVNGNSLIISAPMSTRHLSSDTASYRKDYAVTNSKVVRGLTTFGKLANMNPPDQKVKGKDLNSRSKRSSSIVTTEIATDIVIWQMEPPIPGKWRLKFNQDIPYHVTVTGISPIDFRYNFLDMRSQMAIAGRPVAGDTTLMRFYVTGLTCILKVTTLVFYDVDGLELQHVTVDDSQLSLGQTPKSYRNHTLVFFKMPMQDFRLSLEGYDVTHQLFQRVDSHLVRPRHFVISLIDYRAVPLAPGTDYKFGIRIRNKGPQDVFYTTANFSSLSYITARATPSPVVVARGDITHVAIVIQIQPEITFIRKSQMTISVRRKSDGSMETMMEEVTAMPERFLVDYEAPICRTLKTTGGCYMGVPCEKQWWGQSISVVDQSSGVRSAVVSDSPRNAFIGAQFFYSMSDRTALVNYTGDCCTMEVSLDVMDYANNPNTCLVKASLLTGTSIFPLTHTVAAISTKSTTVPKKTSTMTTHDSTFSISHHESTSSLSPTLTSGSKKKHSSSSSSLLNSSKRTPGTTRSPEIDTTVSSQGSASSSTSEINQTVPVLERTEKDRNDLSDTKLATIVLGCIASLAGITLTSLCLIILRRRCRESTPRRDTEGSDYTMGSSWESNNGSWGRASLSSDVIMAASSGLDNVSTINLVAESDLDSPDDGFMSTTGSCASSDITVYNTRYGCPEGILHNPSLERPAGAEEDWRDCESSRSSKMTTRYLYEELKRVQRYVEDTIRRGNDLLSEGEEFQNSHMEFEQGVQCSDPDEYCENENNTNSKATRQKQTRGRSKSIGSRIFGKRKKNINESVGNSSSQLTVSSDAKYKVNSQNRVCTNHAACSSSATHSPELRRYVLEQNFRRSRESSPNGSLKNVSEVCMQGRLTQTSPESASAGHHGEAYNEDNDSDAEPYEAILINSDGQWVLKRIQDHGECETSPKHYGDYSEDQMGMVLTGRPQTASFSSNSTDSLKENHGETVNPSQTEPSISTGEIKIIVAGSSQEDSSGNTPVDPLNVASMMQEYEEQQELRRRIQCMKQRLLDYQRRIDQQIEVEEQRSRASSRDCNSRDVEEI